MDSLEHAGPRNYGFKLPLYRKNNSAKHRRRQDGQDSTAGNSSDVTVQASNEFAYLTRIKAADQEFTVTIDTASSDLWLASEDCQLDVCQSIPLYKNSTSLYATNEPFKLEYLSGGVAGQVSYETIRFGRFEITSQVFGLVSNFSGIDVASSGSSGILGLAFPKPAAISAKNGPTILENIMNSIPAGSRYFGFMGGRGSDAGSFTVGQLDDAVVTNRTLLRTQVQANPDGSYDYWKLPLRSIVINNQTLPLSSTRKISNSPGGLPVAVLDTGTTLILGPQEDVDLLYSVVRTARKRSKDGNDLSANSTERGTWEVDCTELIELKLQFVLSGPTSTTDGASTDFWIDPLDMSWDGIKSPDGQYCLGGIQGNDNVVSGDWLLGDAALRNIYVAHYVATGDQLPNLALLNVTDKDLAMAAFTMIRGLPTFPLNSTIPILNRSNTIGARKQSVPEHHAARRQQITILVLATVISFIIGLGAVLIIMIRKERRNWARMHGFQGPIIRGKRIKPRKTRRFWIRS
ncbi:hypothetical protein FRC02_011991 [Tulasnella sp. 418]|nr:hypothetical protein FRC02_011991 [Tulasnella sp. 418]